MKYKIRKETFKSGLINYYPIYKKFLFWHYYYLNEEFDVEIVVFNDKEKAIDFIEKDKKKRDKLVKVEYIEIK